MSDYTKATNFTSKDTLPTGNAGKIVKGTELDTEFTAIASAITSKANSNDAVLTGAPTAPTASAGTATTQIANTIFVNNERTATATLTNKTLTSPAINTPVIIGGSIDNAPIGATTANTGKFTTIESAGLIESKATGFKFPDATTQYTAFTGQLGLKTLTLSTATPNATLTASDNQYIRVVLDTTTPYQPSITLPNMTTLTTGWGRFVISNETGLVLAVKDNGGTIREYLPAKGEYTLNITSVATSNGVWYFQNSPALVQGYTGPSTYIGRSWMQTPAGSVASGMFLRLDSTNFVYIFVQQYPYNNGTYAQLFTVNTSTGAFTTGNRVTLSATTYTATAWDTDDAGHALILVTSGQVTITYGLSVSGGTLYASAGASIDVGAGNSTNNHWVAYLGSNSAYAYGWGYGTSGCCFVPTSSYIRGATVTGTTTVTQTQSASNSTVANGTSPARTSVTTFTAGAQYVSYTPSTNTYTKGARTTANSIESSGSGYQCSAGQYGWSYCSGKVMQGGFVYDVTNVGAAGVTAVQSASFQAKPQISTNYLTVTQVGIKGFYNAFPGGAGDQYSAFYSNYNSGFLASSSKNIVISSGTLLQVDPTSSTLNLGVSGAYATAQNSPMPSGIVVLPGLLMSATYAVGTTFIYNDGLYLQGYPLATSIV